MQKKVLVGVGIGCGVLLLLALVGVGVAGYWAKKTFGGAVEAGQQMALQEKDLQELNKSYAFTPPPEGEVLALNEARLNDYFAIRDAALPLFKDFEKTTESLDAQNEKGEQASLAEGLEAGGRVAQLMAQTRGVYIEHLKKHRMSPREFHAITNALYASAFAESVGQVQQAMAGQREQTEKALAELQAQMADPSLTEEERTALEEQESGLQAQLESLDAAEEGGTLPQLDAKAQGVATANAALLEKFKGRVQNAYNPGFDSLILTEDMKGSLGTALGQQQGE